MNKFTCLVFVVPVLFLNIVEIASANDEAVHAGEAVCQTPGQEIWIKPANKQDPASTDLDYQAIVGSCQGMRRLKGIFFTQELTFSFDQVQGSTNFKNFYHLYIDGKAMKFWFDSYRLVRVFTSNAVHVFLFLGIETETAFEVGPSTHVTIGLKADNTVTVDTSRTRVFTDQYESVIGVGFPSSGDATVFMTEDNKMIYSHSLPPPQYGLKHLRFKGDET